MRRYTRCTVNGATFTCRGSTRLKADDSVFMVEIANPKSSNLADRVQFARAEVFLEHEPPSLESEAAPIQSLVFGSWFKLKQLSDVVLKIPRISAAPHQPLEGSICAASDIMPTSLSLAPLPLGRRRGGFAGFDRESYVVLHRDSNFMSQDYRAAVG